MWGLELATFNREALAKDKAAAPLVRSYLGMRLAIGLIGLILPIVLVLIDQLFLANHQLRGSMSAYYHSSARDVFVGGLVSTGIFLVTYMSAKRRTYDYVISSVAGVLVMIVAFFPTGRAASDFPANAHFATSASSCTDFPGPPICAGTQSWLGEHVTELIHRGSASAFVVLLALLCWVWAVREAALGPRRHDRNASARPDGGSIPVEPPSSLHEATRHLLRTLRYLWDGGVRQPNGSVTHYGPPRRRALAYIAAAVAILLSAAWSLIGTDLPLPWFGRIGRTYVSEFGAFESFGIAWIVAAWDLMPSKIAGAGHQLTRLVDKVSRTP